MRTNKRSWPVRKSEDRHDVAMVRAERNAAMSQEESLQHLKRITELKKENERLRVLVEKRGLPIDMFNDCERLTTENEFLKKDAEILHSELKEYKHALEDARSVIKEAVMRIKPLWPFVVEWLPDTADRQVEDKEINNGRT